MSTHTEYELPDFDFSSELSQARQEIDTEEHIEIYVEGFADITFWHEVFAKFGIKVKTASFAENYQANGKFSIIKAIKDKRITLGPWLCVALDSDYDYLLNIDHDINGQNKLYQTGFCFQTYSYSIENYYFNPVGLTELCYQAVRRPGEYQEAFIENALKKWSADFYAEFCQLLAEQNEESLNANTANSLEQITSDNNQQQTNEQVAATIVPELNSHNLFAFCHGHTLEKKVKEITLALVGKLKIEKKQQLQSAHQDDSEKANQLIAEYFNSTSDINTLIAHRTDFESHPCYHKIEQDIQSFIRSYHS